MRQTIPEHSKRASLNIWKQGVLHGFAEPDELQQELMDLCKRYPIKPEHLAEIIDGVAEDLTQTRYATYQELLSYCYKVASVVGLVSVEIFGYKNSICRDYAINLGFALQLTNIIRDVGEDARMQRIYLPQEDLRRFGVTEAEILDGKPTEAFEKLMELQYLTRASLLFEVCHTATRGRPLSHARGRDDGSGVQRDSGEDPPPALPCLRQAHWP